MSSGIAAQNQLYSSLSSMLLGNADAAPNTAITSTVETLQSMKHSTSSWERDDIHTNLDSILSDMKKAGSANAKKSALIVKKTMGNMILSMKKGSKALKTQAITPELVANSILGQINMSDMPENLRPEMECVMSGLNENLIAFFKLTQAAKEQFS